MPTSCCRYGLKDEDKTLSLSSSLQKQDALVAAMSVFLMYDLVEAAPVHEVSSCQCVLQIAKSGF